MLFLCEYEQSMNVINNLVLGSARIFKVRLILYWLWVYSRLFLKDVKVFLSRVVNVGFLIFSIAFLVRFNIDY